MNNLTILTVVLIFSAIVAIFLTFSMSKHDKNTGVIELNNHENENHENKLLHVKIKNLSDDINILKQNYKTLENQIGDLQSRANIQANSTRFLNTAVNNVLTQV